MNSFFQKIISAVSKIPKGKILSYKETARVAGFPQAIRATANILAKNKNPAIPCHRVIKSNFCVGGFRGNKKDSLEKTGLLLKQDLRILEK